MCRRLYVVDSSSWLYTIDPATASPHLVGAVGLSDVTDIAFHGPTLYGVSFSQFLRLNPDTGAGTVVGATGFSTNGLAVSSDGIVYAGAAGQLIRINQVTGAGTAVGSFGGGLSSEGDLAFDSNDVLYGALTASAGAVLAVINRNTGAATVVGSMQAKNVYGLAFSCCRLYGVTGNGELLDINAATGQATVIGRNAIGHYGMAARCCCCGC